MNIPDVIVTGTHLCACILRYTYALRYRQLVLFLSNAQYSTPNALITKISGSIKQPFFTRLEIAEGYI